MRLHFSAGFAEFFTLQISFFTQCCQVMSFLRFFFLFFFCLIDGLLTLLGAVLPWKWLLRKTKSLDSGGRPTFERQISFALELLYWYWYRFSIWICCWLKIYCFNSDSIQFDLLIISIFAYNCKTFSANAVNYIQIDTVSDAVWFWLTKKNWLLRVI